MTPDDPLRFDALPLRAELLQALGAIGYTSMSPIQAAALPGILAGRDALAQAETGSGKTAAFALGLLQALDATRFETQALVVCPTRELSDQVADEIRRLAGALANTKVLVLCGGQPMHAQLSSLEREPHVVVGTPGRLRKHLDLGTLHLGNVATLVLDEADRMLDMGFHEDIAHLIGGLPRQHQTLLFSATWPDGVIGISRTVQQDPVEVRVAGFDTADRIEQRFVLVTEARKAEVLLGLLGSHRPERALVFCNRRVAAQALCDELVRRGMSARALHGDLEQRERDEAMILFANRSISYLVATDVAARGLDIDALPAVINHDLSPDPETHVHRIGRTGRAGATGIAISLVTADEMHRVRGIEDYLGIEIDVRRAGRVERRWRPRPGSAHLHAAHQRRQEGQDPARGHRGRADRRGRVEIRRHRQDHRAGHDVVRGRGRGTRRGGAGAAVRRPHQEAQGARPAGSVGPSRSRVLRAQKSR